MFPLPLRTGVQGEGAAKNTLILLQLFVMFISLKNGLLAQQVEQLTLNQ